MDVKWHELRKWMSNSDLASEIAVEKLFRNNLDNKKL